MIQLQIVSTNFELASDPITLQESIKFLQNLSHGQGVFLKLECSVTSLVLVTPASNAASERSFSVSRRLFEVYNEASKVVPYNGIAH